MPLSRFTVIGLTPVPGAPACTSTDTHGATSKDNWQTNARDTNRGSGDVAAESARLGDTQDVPPPPYCPGLMNHAPLGPIRTLQPEPWRSAIQELDQRPRGTEDGMAMELGNECLAATRSARGHSRRGASSPGRLSRLSVFTSKGPPFFTTIPPPRAMRMTARVSVVSMFLSRLRWLFVSAFSGT
jgi:hypothetical protein